MDGRLDHSYAAIVMDWDGTAVADRRADARRMRRAVERLCGLGVHMAVVSGTHVGNVDGQLRARPRGPGRLYLALNRGSELFRVGAGGPELVDRREADPDTDRRLDRAADLLCRRLAERGLETALVSERLNRRKIDLIPVAAWRDPPKERLPELVTAVTRRLQGHAFASLAEVVELAERTAAECGLAEVRVTSDAKHVEIGVTDKADSMRALLREFESLGVGPGLVLVVGDEVGEVGGVPGSDSRLILPEAPRLTGVSVGPVRGGLPPGVLDLGGGPARTLALLRLQARRHVLLRAPSIDDDPQWVLAAEGPDRMLHRVEETLFSVGAGGIVTRGALEEPTPLGAPLIAASGVYSGDETADGLLAGPVWHEVPLTRVPARHHRALDLRTGLLIREEIPNEAGIRLRTARFASVAEPGVVAMRVESTDPIPPGELSTWQFAQGEGGAGIGAVTSDRRSHDRSLATFERIGAVVAGPAEGPVRRQAERLGAGARRRGFDRLLAEHREVWAHRWEQVGVSIPGDPEREFALRFALFQIWNLAGQQAGFGASRRDHELAVGARGLSGPGYSGHVFWDADAFVLPALATVDPEAARAMVEYRLRRLDAARARAQADGRAGARFPWESARTGADVTPTHGWLGGDPVPILTGALEEHITADVAWGVVHRTSWSGEPLSARERQLVVETARYWASRVREGADGRAHVDDVIGPDEYHEGVEDNAFTNVMARWNLRVAAHLAGAGVSRTERDRWVHIAEALVDGYDPVTGCHEQFAGYFALDPLLVRELGTPPLAADLLAGRERIAASQVIKQPDALMLHVLVPDELTPGSLERDLELYLPRTAHGSSLSPASCAHLLARAGRPEEALELLALAAQVDLRDEAGTSAAGVHLAAAAGAWRAVLAGFLGIRVREGVVEVDPRVPVVWRDLEARFCVLGAHVRMRLDDGVLFVSADRPVRVARAGARPVDVPGGYREICLEEVRADV